MPQRTMGSLISPSHNSLNALRLFLALLVIVSHAPMTAGLGTPIMVGDVQLGDWAVAGFFVISGWLITGSRLHLDLLPFLWRRSLRIYPAFWVSLAVTAFVFAPLAVGIGDGQWRPDEAWGFVVHNATLHIGQPSIPGSLQGADYTSHWNLSLWTLRWEFGCYLGVGLLLTTAWVRARAWVVVAAFVLVSAPYAALVVIDAPTSLGFAQFSRLGGCFLIGSVAYRYRDRIPARAWIAALAAGVLVALYALGMVRGLGAIPLGYLVLWLGGVLPLQRLGRTNDISYGVYIYAFPVQLLLAIAGAAELGLTLYTALSIALVLPLAWASWLLIERPAMQLKGAVPSRLSRRRPVDPVARTVESPRELRSGRADVPSA
jgi:peptidoglycan/LPS O-acetylase OafA/YrhL